jgi:hypothetical protein
VIHAERSETEYFHEGSVKVRTCLNKRLKIGRSYRNKFNASEYTSSSYVTLSFVPPEFEFVNCALNEINTGIELFLIINAFRF